MKPLIIVYCYFDERYDILDTMEVFPHDNLIIVKKLYDFYHVNTFIDKSDVIAGGLSYSLLDHFSSYVLVIMGQLLY